MEGALTHRFAISVDHDERGCPVGHVHSLEDCAVTGSDMEEMLDLMEEAVRARLIEKGEVADDIELIGYDAWTM